MASALFILFIFFVLIGAPKIAGWFGATAIIAAMAWLLGGPRWWTKL